MLSIKRQKIKKALIIIIITLLVLSLFSFLSTKIIYDQIFKRYNCNITEFPSELQTTIDTREEFKYYSGENMLNGYLYKSKKLSDTLIIIAPGQNACSDNYLWQTHELLECGWSVFSFDATGCCKSEGKSAIGFSQELIDLNATIDFIKNNINFGYKNIVLFGHSRGAYAACCSLKKNNDISAVISISGVNSAMEATIGPATEYVGLLAYSNYANLWLYQSMLFGHEIVNMRADEIVKESNVPILIIHGNNDELYPTDKFSIVSHFDGTQKNTEIIIIDNENSSGHTNLLFDTDGTANNYIIKEINDFLVEKIN